MTREQIVEIMARAIVEFDGGKADENVIGFGNGGYYPIGPLWKVKGVPSATAALTALEAAGILRPSPASAGQEG